MEFERGNRLIKMKSFANWLAPNNEIVCLTLNAYALNGTKTKVGDEVHTLLNTLTDDELKSLVVEMTVNLGQCCYSVSRLSGFGFGLILDRVKAEMSVAFVTNADFEDSRQNRVELNIFITEKLHDSPIGPFQDDSESDSFDSMDASRFYVERLRDFFDGH